MTVRVCLTAAESLPSQPLNEFVTASQNNEADLAAIYDAIASCSDIIVVSGTKDEYDGCYIVH
jgi:molybdopterin-guanine dinucleotide biosynthesis protein